MKKRQVIILGGGPAGSATALHLLRAGIQPLIVERQFFPRFHIGESLSGECRGAVRELGLEDQMLAQGYPVKHGVKVFNPNGVSFWVEVQKRCPETNALIPNSTWSISPKGNPFADYEKVCNQGQTAVCDMIECFWEYPLVFTRMASGANKDDIADLFAGRIYGEVLENNKSRQAMRRLMIKRRAQIAAQPPPRAEAMHAPAFTGASSLESTLR